MIKLAVLAVIIGFIFVALKRRRYPYDLSIEINGKDSDDIGIEVFHKYKSLDDWKNDLRIIWGGPPITIEFTYESGSGENLRTVDIQKIVEDSRGDTYLNGFCHLRNEMRYFSISNISSRIVENGIGYDAVDWVYTKIS